MGKGMIEREISIWDLIWAVCLKWRSILVCAIIFTMLAGGVRLLQSKQSAETPVVEATFESVAAALKYEEKYAADLYCEYRNLYENQKLYNEHAPIMTLNASEFFKGEISYYIDNHYAVEYPVIEKNNNVAAIVNAYQAELKTETFADKVNEVLGIEDSNYYGMELIDFENSYKSSDSFAIKEQQGILTILVYAADEETCNALKQLVKEEIDNKKAGVVNKFGEHDVTMIQDSCIFTADADILEYQQLKISKVQECLSSMNSLVTQFTDKQKQYVNFRMEEMHGETTSKAGTESVAAVATTSISVKMLLLGFIVGAMIAFVAWIVVYILSSKIRLEDDFELLFESKLLGNVPANAKNKKKWFACLDCLFVKMRHLNQRYFEKEESLDMVAANIRIALQKRDNKKVMITGAVCGADEKNVAKELSKRLKKDGIELEFASAILYNAESLEKLVEIGQVVLVEKAEKSLCQEVAREIEICAQQDVKLIGCVMVY